MVRSSCLLKRLAVTDLKADVSRLPKKGELTKAYEGMLPHCGSAPAALSLTQKSRCLKLCVFTRMSIGLESSRFATEFVAKTAE